MTLDQTTIKELPYPLFMTWQLAEPWATEIPSYSENDPHNPEWQPTPCFHLDLTAEGHGTVYIKDESVNPTGTHKDRPAWEMAAVYRDFARSLLSRKKVIDGEIERIVVPRMTILSCGNEARALAVRFVQHHLPPVKIFLNQDIPAERLLVLQQLHADIYQADFGKKALTPEEIQRFTNNNGGIDLTSVVSLRPQEIFYDWLAHETFNQAPDEIYTPYGSGRLHENLLTHQEKNARSYLSAGKTDPRMQIPLEKLVSISILAAEPEESESAADKLPAPYKPFKIFKYADINALHTLAFTGTETGVYSVREEFIKEAYCLFQKHNLTAEISGAAGLAHYLQRIAEGKIDPKDEKKRVIINTGKGI